MMKRSKKELIKLFTGQMKTLRLRGCSRDIIKVFRDKLDEVLNKAAEMEIPKGHIPFVPVIPYSFMDIPKLMAMVKKDGKIGYTYLNQEKIFDHLEIPGNLYFIYDVKDGKDMLDKSPEQAQKLVKKQKRFCLTVAEAIALCVHTNSSAGHYMYCLGSYHNSLELVPGISLTISGPMLGCYKIETKNKGYGAPSCKMRAV